MSEVRLEGGDNLLVGRARACADAEGGGVGRREGVHRVDAGSALVEASVARQEIGRATSELQSQ